MVPSSSDLEAVGLEVTDLSDRSLLDRRPARHHDRITEMEGLRRLASCFVETPETILQVLSEVAVNLCGADSAGVSIEREDRTEADYYRWIATAGVYTPFLQASLPRYPSACTVCLQRDQPQIFRVRKTFFDVLGVSAAEVSDGLLLPWAVEGMRGTIFIIAHGRPEAFDREDLRLMETFADFAAMGVRQQQLQAARVNDAKVAATVTLANELAHKVNNPLQGLTNMLYMAASGSGLPGEQDLAKRLLPDFERICSLVKVLLELPRSQMQITTVQCDHSPRSTVHNTRYRT